LCKRLSANAGYTQAVAAGLIYNFKSGTVENSYAYAFSASTSGTGEQSNYIYDNDSGTEIPNPGYPGMTQEFTDKLNTDGVWYYTNRSYPLLLDRLNYDDSTEIIVENTIKTFRITTEVKIINDVKGGTISGDAEESYEIVKYGENNTKEIEMTANEGYAISKLTVNGKEIPFYEENGTYVLEADYFSNIKEDKHIVVEYTPLEQVLKIVKVDEDDSSKKLPGAVIKIKGVEKIEPQINNVGSYYFGFDGEKYVANNGNKAYSTANAYIPLDLTGCEGVCTVTVNAEIVCDSGDVGYAIANTSVNNPSRYTEMGRFINVSQSQSPTDYSIELNGGKYYYIHLGFYNYGTNENNTFTINSIDIDLSEITKKYVTDENGQIIVTANTNEEIEIEEVEAPEGYTLNSEKIIHRMTGNNNEEIITNKAKTDVIVHHYLVNTENKVAPDEIYKGDIGDDYSVNPHINLDKLSPIKDIDGNYIIPENSSGKYIDGSIEVIFYYEPENIKLTIHHYIEGTEDELTETQIIEKVPEVVFNEDETCSVVVNESYKLDENDFYCNNTEYEFTRVTAKELSDSSIDNEKNITDSFEYTTDAEINYYYKATNESYSVHYFYDGIEDESKTDTFDTIVGRKIGEYTDKVIERYRFDSAVAVNEFGEETDLPLIVRRIEDGQENTNIINVYYLRNQLYTVHYFYNGVEDESEVKIYESIKDTEINTFEQTKRKNYELEKVKAFNENKEEVDLPLIIRMDESTNVINVYYISNMKYDITTEIVDNEKARREGGTVTGVFNEDYLEENNIRYVETVIAGHNAANDIIVTPDVGYHVDSIKINKNNYDFVPDETGKVVIPKENFLSVENDIHIKVRFAEDTKTVTIKKEDEQGNGLAGAKFEISAKDIEALEYLGVIRNYDMDGYGAYEMEEQSDGTYVSNNNYDNTSAVSYMDLDFSNIQGGYKLIVNAKISSEQNKDWGYVVVKRVKGEIATNTSTTTNTSTGTSTSTSTGSEDDGETEDNPDEWYLFKISGEVASRDYWTTLKGGEKYEVYFVYGKDESNSLGDDEFTINNVRLVKSGYDVTKVTDETDENGYTTIDITGYGDYTIKEVQAPEHYTLNDEEHEITIEPTVDVYNDTFVNMHKPYVIVHHYYKDTDGTLTTNKVAEDEITEKNPEETYETSAKENLEGLTRAKENGVVIEPENKTGTIHEENVEVNYYYGSVPITLTIHHYEDGTTNKLKDDETVVSTPEITFQGDTYEISKELTYDISENSNYKDLIETYTLTKIIDNGVAEPDNTLNIDDNYTYESDAEITYFYAEATVPKATYTVNYLEKNTVNPVNTAKTSEEVDVGTEITAADEVIDVTGYRYDSSDIEILTVGENSVDNVINLYYVKDNFGYTVHYFYDGVEDEDEIETLSAAYKSIITTYEDKVRPGYVLSEVSPVDDTTGELALEITSNPNDNRINVFYRTQYKVTTEAISHTEVNKDGTTRTVKGGSISGDGLVSYENVLKGDDTTKAIVMVPNNGYEIVGVKVNDVNTDYESLLSNTGSLTLNASNGFFTDMNEDKHIEVEFRKKSNVIVKYLEKDTEEVLATQDEIYGNEGEAFETARKSVSYYQAVNITDENGNAISTYSRVTSDDTLSAIGTMYADTLTIIYWYERIPSGIIVKHIAINEVDKQDLDIEDGTVLDEETIASYASQTETTNRKDYTNYIAVNGPASSSNVIVATAEENSKTVTCGENVVKEVRYYYERQYKVTTECGEGGTISGESDDVYELINDRGYNSKEIVITPDDGYRVKEVKVNGIVYPLSELDEDETTHVITLGAGRTNAFFTDVQEDKHVVVEFEKIPAKVIVKYKDTATGEEVVGTPEKVVNGYVGDEYNEQAIDIPGYILAEDTTEHPLPTNISGPMIEADIEIVYWYTKQFTITTSAGVGGTSVIEGNVDEEVVTRGDSNTLKITITPDSAHTLDKILINGVELDYENDPNIVIGDGYVEIPANYFTNVQENIYVVAEFAPIPATVKVEYLDEETNESLYVGEDGKEYDTIAGYVNDEYNATPKDIPYYTVVEEKLPRNARGTMGTDEVMVTYYYRKSLFNMGIEKEIVDVVVNNESMSEFNKKNIDVSIKYKDISDVNIKVIYNVKVTNTEEVVGRAVVEESLPEGFEFVASESEGNWELVDGKYILTTDEILPGASREYMVVLRWLVSEENDGKKTNIASITDTENGANYEETTTDDNESRAIINITLEYTDEEIEEPEVDISDKELEPELVVPEENSDTVTKKKIKSVKTGDYSVYYLVSMAIAGIIMVIAIKKKFN